MLTDTEVDALAREIIESTVVRFSEWDSLLVNHVTEILGEPVISYAATNEYGFGSFLCRFVPLDPAKELIKTCEELFDSFGVEVFDKASGQPVKRLISEGHDPESRAFSIKMMAECAINQLLGSVRDRLGDALEEIFADSEMIAKTMLQAVVAQALSEASELGDVRACADMRTEIEAAAVRVAKKKRDYLRSQVRNLPNVLAERRRGAPGKSPLTRERERVLYIQRIQDAYRAIWIETGKKPTKTSMAKRLGEGGFNPKTGGESYLQAFRLKLIRLEIDYDETVRKVEENKNQKSE
jgi:hypothetical protein